jgi:hypothetical protein
MSTGNQDFDDMAREFQRIDAPSADLVRAVKKGRRKLRDGLITVGVLGVLTSAAGVAVLYRDHDAPAVLFATMEIGFPVLVLAFSAYSQRNAWRAKSETVRGFLGLQLERCRVKLRAQRFLRWALLFLVPLIGAYHALLVERHPGMLSWHAAAVVGLGGPYAILAGILWYSWRKNAQLLRKEAVLMKELADLDDLRA